MSSNSRADPVTWLEGAAFVLGVLAVLVIAP